MHSTSGTALSSILRFQTRLSTLSEPPLRACQSNSFAFVRPDASTEAWLCCSRFKPATENDWLARRGMGSYLHFKILVLLIEALQNHPVWQEKGGDIWGQKGRGWERNHGVMPPPSRVLTCHLHSFCFYFGTMDKERWCPLIWKPRKSTQAQEHSRVLRKGKPAWELGCTLYNEAGA